ncbi:hypothetical protein ACJJTC_012182 [Scirpophaga incertulas]
MGVVEYLIIALLIIHHASSLHVGICEEHKTCNECILEPSVCVWCASKILNGPRCKTANALPENWCPDALQNPQNNITVQKSANLDFNSNLGEVTQIKPQKYKISLRPGVPLDFKFSFKPAPHYPVDLYFLLDLSKTMQNVKTTIEEQSNKIYETMNTLTSNIRLGIGSFIDKNTLPYTNKINNHLTYSFKNRMKLTNDTGKFKIAVSEMEFGQNHDFPEGGLDALAQAIVCQEDIGWRNESRKIIVFLTDGPYHSAGDGLTGGIFQPYDGQCYMKDNVYTKELVMDYPSISIINKIAASEGITVIFAVTNEVQNIYSHLSEAISGSKCISNEDNQMVSILNKIYNEITRTIKLKTNMKSGQRSNFYLSFNPNCAIANDDCSVKTDQVKEITGTIKLLQYFGINNTTVTIGIEGIKEKLILDIEIINYCECEHSGVKEAPECSDAGTFQCGICKCDPKRYGDKCGCISNNFNNVNDSLTCVAPGDITTVGDNVICSGHGSCFCGYCVCRKNSPYEGKYCEFNKDNCPRFDDVVCNGHGRCENEKCICTDPGWSGHACECQDKSKKCTGPNGKVCSALGECHCSVCVCNRTASWDAREALDQFCNIQPCPYCHMSQCKILEDCAICLYYDKKDCASCQHFEAKLTQDAITSRNSSWNVCPDLRVDVGCYTRFMYRYDDDKYVIEMVVQTDNNCLESYYLFGGIFLAALILIGVATLVAWKWLTDSRDRREYERFLKEHQEDLSPPCSNPTYRPASTTINNPAFRKPSVC